MLEQVKIRLEKLLTVVNQLYTVLIFQMMMYESKSVSSLQKPKKKGGNQATYLKIMFM